MSEERRLVVVGGPNGAGKTTFALDYGPQTGLRANRPLPIELYQETIELQRIGTRAVRRAREENRRLGIPNAFTRDGKLYFELPDGTITQDNPFEKDPLA